ncbi:MAG: sulfotransferase [Spirochaetes bacterium]|nr:sulfotransferase [Spirochaetota bacterium]
MNKPLRKVPLIYSKNQTKSNKFFFVVGRGRSGTTLLASMLNSHPGIAVPPEALFIMTLYSTYCHINRWTTKKLLKFYEDLMTEEWLQNWNLDNEKLKKDLLACKGQTTFSELCKIVYMHYWRASKNNENLVIGDKNPQYSLFVDVLIELFPDAQFIHITRDYRDNILSFKNVRFDLNLTSALAHRWKKYNQMILKMKDKYPEKFLTIRYEDLVAEPETTLRKITSFISIEYHSAMLDFHKNQTQELPSFHKNLKRPIVKQNINKWKSKMSADDIEQADYICDKTGKLFGYYPNRPLRPFFLFWKTLFGRILGSCSMVVEKGYFFLPIFISKKIASTYRKIIHQSKYLKDV